MKSAVIGVLAGLAVADAHQQGDAPIQTDVLIIGAGWAGMSAANHLALKGKHNFLVLESSNRTGGRSHAMTFGNPKVKSFVIEQGSNWVSGLGGGAAGHVKGYTELPWENPVYVLMQQENLTTVLIPGGCDGNMSGYDVVYTPTGDPNGDPGGVIRSKANDALDCLNRTAPDAAWSTTIREGLIACGWTPRTPMEWAVDWAMSGEDANGEPASSQSLTEFMPDPTFQWWGADERFVIDQDPRGFARLIDGMVRGTVPDTKVSLNTEVTNINYGCDGVVVTVADGRTFNAKQVISTVSLGVLQRKHSTLFTPSLSAAKITALTKDIRMGNLTHVVAQFDKVWWDDSLFKWIASNEDATDNTGSGNFAVWHNLNHQTLIPGSQSLLSFLGDPQSSIYEGLSDEDAQAGMMKYVRKQHPDTIIPDPVDFFISRHGYDPNTYGAYAFFEPGFKDRYYKDLISPLTACKENKVYFSGEVMCGNLDGYTHGGYQAGKEAAAQVLFDIGEGPNPNHDIGTSLCFFDH